MVLRDLVHVVTPVEVFDEYGGSSVTYRTVQKVYCNVRIVFSKNEDGLQNRQGLSHFEGTLITRDDFKTDYFIYDGKIYHILIRNPQAKQYAYKFREVRNG